MGKRVAAVRTASSERGAGRARPLELRLAGCAVLVAAVALVFYPVVGFGFLGLDDPRYVTANEHVQKGLTADNVRWALITTDSGFYSPVTRLSHAADAQFYGLRPWGHHLTSLLLHAASAVLVFLALSRMTGRTLPAFVVAALFAVHPLHVEPVAWIAERKEVLCGFFWFLTLFLYALYATRPSRTRYAGVLAVYLLALLAKPMAVTLPLALLLLDYWPLGRWSAGPRGTGSPAKPRALLLEKLPMLLPLPVVSFLTIGAQADIGALGSNAAFPLGERIANALHAYGAYLYMTFVPFRLAALYPFEHGTLPLWKPAAGALVLAAGSVAAVLLARRRPHVAVGWFWYVGTLVPVIGLVHVGSQSMADRYTYVPLIGIFVILAWEGSAALARAGRTWRKPATAFVVLVLAGLAVIAHVQVGTWAGDEVLYEQILRVSPGAVLAWFNLGNLYLYDRNDPARARELYEKGLAVDPRYADLHLNLGLALGRLGRPEEALAHFQEAVRLKPDRPEAHRDVATALMNMRRFADAAAALRAYVALRPRDSEAWGMYGFALLSGGGRREARQAFERALDLAPRASQPIFYLGMMALDEGNVVEARARLDVLRGIDPGIARALEERLSQLGH